MDFISAVAVANGVGVLWPVIQEKLKEAGGEFIKTRFSEALAELVPAGRGDKGWDKATGVVLAQSLPKLVERAEVALKDVDVDLENGDVRDVGAYAAAFSDLLASGAVQATLARAFVGDTPSEVVLREVWGQMGLRALPDGFEWGPAIKQFCKTVTVAAGKDEKIKAVLDTANLARIAETAELSSPRTPGFNLSGYRQAIRAAHGNLKLQQLAAEAQVKTPVGLRQVFVNPHVIEQGSLPEDFYRLPIEDQHRLRAGTLEKHHVLDEETLKKFAELFKAARPEGALEFIANQQWLVLTGDPGSGKSTLMQCLALEWADKAGTKEAPGAVPLLIELRRYAEQRGDNERVVDFPSYLQHGTDQAWQLEAKAVEKALENGEASLVLDGFDEVFDAQMRGEIESLMLRAKIAWPEAQIILTTRPYGYKPAVLQQAGFHHAHVQPFDDAQVQAFLERWHQQIEDVDRADLQRRLARQISTKPRMKELAGNPLLLTMMALLNRTSNLPDRRADLYARCVDLLVHQWEAEVHRLPTGPDFGPYAKDSRQLSLDEKRALLRAVAHRMQATKDALALNVIDAESLEEALAEALPSWIEACDKRRVAKELVGKLQGRNYILASLGSGRFGFVHRTFLEFCCADYYLFLLKEEGLGEDEFFGDTFGGHWQDSEWLEVLLLIASQLQPSRLRGVLVKMEGINLVPADDKREVLYFIAKVLGEAKDRQGLEGVGAALWKRIMHIWDENVLHQGDNVSGDTAHMVRTMEAIRDGWSSQPDALRWVEGCITDNKNPIIKAVALNGFVAMRGYDENARATAEELVCKSDSVTAYFMLSALVISWRDNSMVEFTYQKLSSSVDDYYLCAIILSKFYSAEEKAKQYCIDMTINSTGFNKRILVNLLCGGWGNDKQVHDLIRQIAEDTQEELEIREVCVKLLKSIKN